MQKTSKRGLLRRNKGIIEEYGRLKKYAADQVNLLKQKNVALFMTGVALRIADPKNKLFNDFFKEETVKAMDEHIASLQKEKSAESTPEIIEVSTTQEPDPPEEVVDLSTDLQ